jgi:formin-binding protein 1
MHVLISATVRAIYQYDAQGDDELALKEGELIKLTSGPTGGQNYGDGWWEGMYLLFFPRLLVRITTTGLTSKGRKGIFPSNYVGYFSNRLVMKKLNLVAWQVEMA